MALRRGLREQRAAVDRAGKAGKTESAAEPFTGVSSGEESVSVLS